MAEDVMKLNYKVSGTDFLAAGAASSAVKKVLRKLCVDPDVIRKVAIPMYEAEINMVIHANGGEIDVEISSDTIYVKLKDNGPGIEDVNLAMQEGYSTAPDNIRSLGFGAGMGLPNMKRYTDEMKIESEIGRGTTIYMSVNV